MPSSAGRPRTRTNFHPRRAKFQIWHLWGSSHQAPGKFRPCGSRSAVARAVHGKRVPRRNADNAGRGFKISPNTSDPNPVGSSVTQQSFESPERRRGFARRHRTRIKRMVAKISSGQPAAVGSRSASSAGDGETPLGARVHADYPHTILLGETIALASVPRSRKAPRIRSALVRTSGRVRALNSPNNFRRSPAFPGDPEGGHDCPTVLRHTGSALVAADLRPAIPRELLAPKTLVPRF